MLKGRLCYFQPFWTNHQLDSCSLSIVGLPSPASRQQEWTKERLECLCSQTGLSWRSRSKNVFRKSFAFPNHEGKCYYFVMFGQPIAKFDHFILYDGLHTGLSESEIFQVSQKESPLFSPVIASSSNNSRIPILVFWPNGIPSGSTLIVGNIGWTMW